MVIETLRQHRESIALQIRQLKENLVHIDAVIAMLEPGSIRPPRRKHGEVTRAVLNALRENGNPMLVEQIAEAVGLDAQQIRIALTQQRNKGTVRKDEMGAWKITIG